MSGVIHSDAVVVSIRLSEVYSRRDLDLVSPWLESEYVIGDHLHTRSILGVLYESPYVLV